ALACQMYGTDNKGFIPEFGPGYKSNPLLSSTYSDVHASILQGWTFSSFSWRNYNANLDFGLGRLIYRRYISDPKILVCPAIPSALDPNNTTRAAYYFNPHPAWYLTENGTVTDRYKKLTDFRQLDRATKPL